MDNESKVKWTIIGSISIASYAMLTTLNQLAIKASGLTIAQCAIARFGIQFILATLWWNIKRPVKPHLFASLNDDTDTDVTIKNWYGDAGLIGNIWARGILYASNQFLFYISLILLPIGDDQCILYQSPLLVVYFGAIILKEKLPDWYILVPSTLMTIIGILLITQPRFLLKIIDASKSDSYEPLNVYGVIMAFISAINWVPIVLLIRKATNAHFLQLEFASSGCVCFVTLPATLLINHYFLQIEFIGSFNINEWSFDIYSMVIMIGIGFGGFAQILFSVVGYQIGETTYVSWLEYITIPMGFLFQSIFFNDTPNRYEIIGGTLVTTGCLLPMIKQLYCYFQNAKKTDLQISDNTSTYSDNSSEVELLNYYHD